MPDGAEWAPRPRIDNAMVKALARAFRWRKMLDEGAFGTLEDLAKSKGIAKTYVSQILRLTLLAPEIIERFSMGGSRRGCSWMICWRDFRWSGSGRGGALACATRPVCQQHRPSTDCGADRDCRAPLARRGPWSADAGRCSPERGPEVSGFGPAPDRPTERARRMIDRFAGTALRTSTISAGHWRT